MTDHAFAGYDIKVDRHLAGLNKALMTDDRTLVVPPAVWELMRHADSAELRHILAHLPVIDLRRFQLDLSAAIGFTASEDRP